MNFMKRTVSALLAAAVLTAPVAFAESYYNAIAEVNQIKSFINRGLYLEAIRDCGNTIAWHNLSPDDVTLINGLKSDAEQKYNNYINGGGSYYNATAEVNQIRSYINRGLYLEAIRDCENTIAWHNLSPDDVSLINDLLWQANMSYSDYKEFASWAPDMIGTWYDEGDPPTIALEINALTEKYADVKVYRNRGKDIVYHINRAEIVDMDTYKASGYTEWMGNRQYCTFRFEMSTDEVLMTTQYNDGSTTTDTFIRRHL